MTNKFSIFLDISYFIIIFIFRNYKKISTAIEQFLLFPVTISYAAIILNLQPIFIFLDTSEHCNDFCAFEIYFNAIILYITFTNLLLKYELVQ